SLDLLGLGRRQNLARGEFANGSAQDLSGSAGGKINRVRVGEGDRLRLTVAPRSNHGCDTTHVRLAVRSLNPSATSDLATDLVTDPLAGNPHPDRLGHREVWSLVAVNDPARPPAIDPEFAPIAALVADPKSDPEAVSAAAEAFQKQFARVDSSSPFWVRTR